MKKNVELTEQEKELLKLTVWLYDGFHSLPDKHPCDMDDLRFHVHAIQNKIMKRLAARAHPELFNGGTS